MTKRTRKQKTFNRNNFAEHNYNYVNRAQTNKPSRAITQNRLFSQKQNFQQPSSNSVNFNDYSQISQDQSENFPFFQQNKNNRQQNRYRHQTPHYTSNYFASDDEDYNNQNHQQFYQNQRLHSYHVNQPDIFETYTHEQHMQQPRPNLASQNNSFYSKNPACTLSYQPTQMQNEIPLPYYLQQHEITNSQLTNFSQKPNAAESLQMTMNPYLMGGSSIT